jgi:hypothetical protein
MTEDYGADQSNEEENSDEIPDEGEASIIPATKIKIKPGKGKKMPPAYKRTGQIN